MRGLSSCITSKFSLIMSQELSRLSSAEDKGDGKGPYPCDKCGRWIGNLSVHFTTPDLRVLIAI
jgi:hypothetical protein